MHERFEEIKALLDQKDWDRLRSTVAELQPADIADLLLEMDKLDRVLFFRALPRRISSDVFSFVEPEHQSSLILDFTEEETRQLLNRLKPDDRTQLFEELPGEVTQKLLNLLPRDDLEEARELLGYPEGSVGRLMTPEYVAVRAHWSIAHALDHIREKGRHLEDFTVVYVVDDKWKLLDELRLSRFLLAGPDQTVQDIMDHVFVSTTATEDQEQVVQVMERYDLTAVPVVSAEGVLVGVVTDADLTPVDIDYRYAGATFLWRKRIGWLMLLLVADFFSSSVIAAYDGAIEAVVALAYFIPMLIDSGGNTGTQSAALIIRGLATGQLSLRDWPKVVSKELGVGLMLGGALALVVYGRSYFWRGGPEVGQVVAVTMLILVVWANLVGALLPMLLSRLRLDPAVVSSPFITTVVDVTGLFVYFNVARWLLGL
jgi:magnesium transporter